MEIKKKNRSFVVFAAATIAAAYFIAGTQFSGAASIEELQKEVEAKKTEIKKLEEEAAKYREAAAGQERMGKTLSAELLRINSEIARLKTETRITEQKFEQTQLEIRGLALEIDEKEAAIARYQGGLAALIKTLAEKDKESALELVLKYNGLSDFFSHVDFTVRTEKEMGDSIASLRTIKTELAGNKENAEQKKEALADLASSLKSQRQVEESAQKNKKDLLIATKSQEKRYLELLQDRERRRRALENEILSIEEKIRVAIDPSTLPKKRPGVFGSPLPGVILASCGTSLGNCITQYFGYTSFANAGGYGGKGHNGMDFRADTGTPVLAAEEGAVEGIGDTDTGCQGVSYGKWILIRHPNNLSTIYSHLSQISVSPGKNVVRGERIGFSGKTGYATGPHLHFGVFVTKAVKIQTIISKVCGRPMMLPTVGSDPVSGIEGYLNPLDYL